MYFAGEMARLAAASTNGRDSGEVSNRNVSGILLSVADYGDLSKLTLSVELRTSEGSEILVSEMPGVLLAELSDLEYGQSLAQETADVTGAGSALKQLSCFLPLGFLRLTGADTLAVTISGSSSALTGAVKVGWASAGFKLSEQILKWRVYDADKNLSVNDVRGLYLYRRTVTTPSTDAAYALTSAKLSATMRIADTEHVTPGDFAFAASCALGEIAGQFPVATVVLFRDPEGEAGVQDVAISLSGTDTASWSIVSATYAGGPTRAARKAAEAARSAFSSIQKLEIDRPAAAQAARFQGRLPASGDMGREADSRASKAASFLAHTAGGSIFGG